MGKDAVFTSRRELFLGECSCDLHNVEHEPASILHYHDFCEIFFYLGETGRFLIDGTEYSVRRGDLVLVDMFVPHMAIPGQPDEDSFFVVHFTGELLTGLGMANGDLLGLFRRKETVYSVPLSSYPRYEQIIRVYQQVQLSRGQELLVRALTQQLIAYICNDCFSGETANETVSHNQTVVNQVIRYINAHLTEKFTLETLAREVSYSQCYLCHLFKEVTRRQLTAYIQEKRIEQATRLLREGRSAQEAANQSGFRNYSHFYKVFRKQTGMSPGEWKSGGNGRYLIR